MSITKDSVSKLSLQFSKSEKPHVENYYSKVNPVRGCSSPLSFDYNHFAINEDDEPAIKNKPRLTSYESSDEFDDISLTGFKFPLANCDSNQGDILDVDANCDPNYAQAESQDDWQLRAGRFNKDKFSTANKKTEANPVPDNDNQSSNLIIKKPIITSRLAFSLPSFKLTIKPSTSNVEMREIRSHSDCVNYTIKT